MRSLVAGHSYPPSASLYHPGCDRDTFLAHLHSLRATGKTDGKFSFVVPLTAFDLYDFAEVRKACHYTNIGIFTPDEMRASEHAEHGRLVNEGRKRAEH